MANSKLGQLKRKWKNLFHVMRPVDLWHLVLILVSCPIGLVLRLFKKHIWIVSEMENTARDNGYWFFKYLRENYPDWPVYYPIQFDSMDYPKVSQLGNVIRHGSFKHHVYTWAAELDISARTGRGLPARLMSHLFQKKGLYPFKEIFLQHGVIMNVTEFLKKELNNIDLFMTTTLAEAKSIHEDYHYDVEQIPVVGLARYDQLNEFDVNPKQILLMPTWRSWLYPLFGKVTKENTQAVAESQYVKTYCTFLASDRLNHFLEENDLQLLFFPHSQMQPFLKAFTGENSRIKIASMNEYDVQTALKESAFLITDYSSINFDFAYMKKPLCYFQFDEEEFFTRHYPQGYFSYRDHGFGAVITTENALMDVLEQSFASGFAMEDVYQDRVDNTFLYRDSDNCKRILQTILEYRGRIK